MGRRAGSPFAGGRVVETDGHPVVLGEWLGAPGAPTILVYGHYDVQPPGDELAEWTTPALRRRASATARIYARGATDDKGQLLRAARRSREAFLAATGALPLNVSFLFEGEEEIGSPQPRRPSCASIATSSPPTSSSPPTARCGARREPSIPIAAQGLLGPRDRRHRARRPTSTPAVTAARSRTRSTRWREILAGLHRPTAPSPSPASTTTSRRSPPPTARRSPASRSTRRLPGRARRPALTASPATRRSNGSGRARRSRSTRIAAAAHSPSSRTRDAHITCRLVPDQDPDAVLEAISRHVSRRPPARRRGRRRGPRRTASRAYAIPADHPADPGRRAALRTVYRTASRCSSASAARSRPRRSSSEMLGLKTLFFSFSTADENLHAPNEFFRLAASRRACARGRALALLATGRHPPRLG